MIKTYNIYYLENPSTRQPFYVGKTRRSLEERFLQHLSQNKKVGELLAQGVFPTIELLEEVTYASSSLTEAYWIDQFIAWGFELSNSRNAKPVHMGRHNDRVKAKKPTSLERFVKEQRESDRYKKYIQTKRDLINRRKELFEAK